jgi:hypothetical protein
MEPATAETGGAGKTSAPDAVMPPRANQLRTRAVHAGEDPSLAVRSLSDPISPGGVFAFRDP